MKVEDRNQLLKELDRLTKAKANTSDFGEQMELAGNIHAIEMTLNGIKPTDSAIDCEGCGS